MGIRIASRIVKERMEAHTPPPTAPSSSVPPPPGPPSNVQETAARPPAPAQPPTAQSAPDPNTQHPRNAQAESRVETASRQAAETVRQQAEAAARTVRQQAPVAAAKARGVGVGAKRFGQALWGPFAHVSSVLWSEVTGVFFALFAVFFANGIFKYRAEYAAGPSHDKFVLDVVLTVVFGYFALSSFYIARRKEKKKR